MLKFSVSICAYLRIFAQNYTYLRKFPQMRFKYVSHKIKLEIMFSCEICKKEFSFKYNLTHHKKTAKYCLELQGKSSENFECSFCAKKFVSQRNLNDHILICKKKGKQDGEDQKNFYDKKIMELTEKLEKQRLEYEEKFDKLRREYEEKYERQKQEYKEDIVRERNIINQIAMKPTTTNNTNNTINNMNSINFNDKERLDDVIRKNLTERVVEQGQIGIADIVYHKYLKDDSGKQLYLCIDAARQTFQFVDPEGNLITDVGAKILTNAVATSNLKNETAKIAKNMKGLYEDKDKFNNMMSLTSEFENDNSAFRKEIVHLTKKDQKIKVKKSK